MTRRILAGVQVLDITQIVAGPWCTRMLADLGASVVKIDPPGPATVDGKPRRSAGPLAQNLGKRSIVLDLKHPEGLAVVKRLAAQADVFVQNYRPGGLAALGLGYTALRTENPGLIYTTIAGFGQNTSFADRGAYGATAHAEAGLLWVQQQAQGVLNYAIVDEVDNILIDEARAPLIISGPARDDVTKYTKADKIPRVLGGLGVAVLSTSQGLMTDREARKRRMGGEILCFVW